MFEGMTHTGSPSLHHIHEESSSEDDSTLSEGDNSGSPLLRVCNTMKPISPLNTTPPLEDIIVSNSTDEAVVDRYTNTPP
jgi:hypothetical protein